MHIDKSLCLMCSMHCSDGCLGLHRYAILQAAVNVEAKQRQQAEEQQQSLSGDLAAERTKGS